MDDKGSLGSDSCLGCVVVVEIHLKVVKGPLGRRQADSGCGGREGEGEGGRKEGGREGKSEKEKDMNERETER